MMNEFLDLERWLQWLSGLDREFVFLLALPFVVAIIGLWSALAGGERMEEEDEERAAPEGRRREDLGSVAEQSR